MAVASHVAKTEDSQALVEKVMKEFGRIDILLNNAGTDPYYGPLMDQDEKTWDITMNVNVRGLFFLSQLAARVMKAQGGGAIISTSSIAGLRAGDLGAYGVTKAAVIMLTQAMAKRVGAVQYPGERHCPRDHQDTPQRGPVERRRRPMRRPFPRSP